MRSLAHQFAHNTAIFHAFRLPVAASVLRTPHPAYRTLIVAMLHMVRLRTAMMHAVCGAPMIACVRLHVCVPCRKRQASITTELIEIIAGASALVDSE